MKYTTVESFKEAAAEQHYTVRQLQGFESYEAYDGEVLVGRYANGEGELGAEQAEFVRPEPLGAAERFVPRDEQGNPILGATS